MIRWALLCLLLAACRRDDPRRFLALMEENEALMRSLAPEIPVERAQPAFERIIENLRAASTLTRDEHLSAEFSRTLADLQPLLRERYNPRMAERLRSACLDCHAKFKE
jgi:hypothetical protein